jgi:hypothetical protein
VGRHPPPSLARANFTLITECTPESSGCNSVYSVCRYDNVMPELTLSPSQRSKNSATGLSRLGFSLSSAATGPCNGLELVIEVPVTCYCSVVDPHHFDADPDPDIYLRRIRIRLLTLMRIRILEKVLK